MLDYVGILFFIAIVIIVVIIFRILRSILVFKLLFKIISITFLILLVFFGISGYFVINDANDFKNNFQNSTNIIIVKDNDKFLSGTTIKISSNDYKSMSSEELSNLEDKYNKNRLSSGESDYYKIILIDIKAYENIEEDTFEIQGFVINKTDIIRILESSDAKIELSKIISEKGKISQSQAYSSITADNVEIKNYLASFSTTYYFNPKNIEHLISELKSNNILIEKETALFRFMKYVPNFLAKSIVEG